METKADLIAFEGNFQPELDEVKAVFEKTQKAWEKKKKAGAIPFSDYIDYWMRKALFMIDEADAYIEDGGDEEDEDPDIFLESRLTIDIVNRFFRYVKNGVTFDEMIDHCNVDEKLIFFDKYKNELTDKKYWETVRKICFGFDSDEDRVKQYKMLYTSNRKGKDYLMKPAEHKALSVLSDKITIYQAMSQEDFKENKLHISWRMSKDSAKSDKTNRFFISKEIENPKIIEVVIKKDEVVAFYKDKKLGNEIIYFHPMKGKGITRRKPVAKKSKM